MICGVGSDFVNSVDMIEYNHFHDDLDRHAYDQVILWEWDPQYRRYNVMEWRLVADNIESKKSNAIPTVVGGICRVRWYDTDRKRYIEVKSKIYRETWTFPSRGDMDPERANKKVYDEKFRRTLEDPPRGYLLTFPHS